MGNGDKAYNFTQFHPISPNFTQLGGQGGF